LWSKLEANEEERNFVEGVDGESEGSRGRVTDHTKERLTIFPTTY